MRNLTVVWLHSKTANGANVYDVGGWTKQFQECLGAMQAKPWKYVSKHMEFAKQACIFDPTSTNPARRPCYVPFDVP